MEQPIPPSTHVEAALGKLHNSGSGALGARPTVVESIIEDGYIRGSIYGTIYPTISGSKNGTEINQSFGRIIDYNNKIRNLSVSKFCLLHEEVPSST